LPPPPPLSFGGGGHPTDITSTVWAEPGLFDGISEEVDLVGPGANLPHHWRGNYVLGARGSSLAVSEPQEGTSVVPPGTPRIKARG
jgi:hypothetical protein